MVIINREKFSSESPASLNTPVLFLIFNRPETTRQVFSAIKKAQPNRLYIAADGPRSEYPDEENHCKIARTIATNVDWDCEVKTLFRDQNLGCRLAVSQAIDWFFEQEPEGIILEEPSDSKAIAKTIDYLMDSKNREPMRQSARLLAEKFTQERNASEMLQIYQKLIEHQKKRNC